MTYIESIAINSDLECTESDVTPGRFNGCRRALVELNSRTRSLQIVIIEFLYMLPPSFRWNVFSFKQFDINNLQKLLHGQMDILNR